MGIYKSFDEQLGKWIWKGFRFVRYYDTEAEADADRENVWEEHMRRLEANAIISRMLIRTRISNNLRDMMYMPMKRDPHSRLYS